MSAMSLLGRELTPQELSGEVPVPEVYILAAELIRKRQEHYSCNAISYITLRLFRPIEFGVRDQYRSQYRRMFYSMPFWDANKLYPKATLEYHRKLRIKALHLMAEACRTSAQPLSLP